MAFVTINRESLKRMIDFIPDEKLTKLHDLLNDWSDDSLTKSDLAEIKAAEKRIVAGEFDTLDKLLYFSRKK